MSKKIKPNKLFDDELEAKEAETEKMPTTEAGIDDASVVGVGRMTEDDAAKLKNYEAMEKSLASISQEKAELEAKVAEYIEKLSLSKDATEAMKKLEQDKEDLAKRCAELDKRNAEVAKLKNEVKALRDENDQYLIKISELTFENANISSQLSELDKKMKSNNMSSNQQKFAPSSGAQYPRNGLAQPNRDAYNPYINNGYASW